MREDLKQADKEDKALDRQRRREKRIKEKMKRKKQTSDSEEDRDEDEDVSASEGEKMGDRKPKRSKIYFDSDSDDGKTTEDREKLVKTDSISLAEQEALALKLLSTMH